MYSRRSNLSGVVCLSVHTHVECLDAGDSSTLWRLSPTVAKGFVCLFVCLNKTRIVKPQGRFHPWVMATHDGPACSTRTARRYSSPARVSWGKQT